jgi:hypothetical protein
MDDLVSVYETYSEPQTQLLAGILVSNGFSAEAFSPRASTVHFASQVLVPRSQAQDARAFVVSFEEESAED